MTNKKGTIITGTIAAILLIAVAVIVIFWRSDAEYYKAQLSEYEKAIAAYNNTLNGNSSDLSDAQKSITDYKNQIAQLESDLEAYKKAIDQVNAERIAVKEESEAKKKAEEEEWNALTDAQRDAITRGRERAQLTNYLLYHNEEYAQLYAYMRDLSDRGLVELSNSEYKTYKANKTRMVELESEAKTILEAEASGNNTGTDD